MNKNLVLAIVLGVLILIAAVQAVQLGGLKSKVSSGGLTSSVKTGAASPTGGAGVGSAPSAGNLPQMVGGC
ncbi:hypothetical protein HZB03_02155 [Candidatus Woesearchaeota archaeon]|nr:hypothetical protein [Candidatus Woesearchaeota archaeon]